MPGQHLKSCFVFDERQARDDLIKDVRCGYRNLHAEPWRQDFL
jgi:hypothetical protein